MSEEMQGGVCTVCGCHCWWIPKIDGELFAQRVCSKECLAKVPAKEGAAESTVKG